MKPTRQETIRKLLLQKPDGLTIAQISEVTGFHRSNINTAIKGMPDVYIDRWVKRERGAYKKVFCAVYVPDDCPHPDSPTKPKTVWRVI